LAEYIQNNPDSAETKRILQWIRKDSWEDVLRKGGYDEFAIEAFYDSMVGLLEEKVGAADATALHREMNEEGGVSDYCTWYCRVIAATYLKQDPDRFLPYIVEAGCNDMGEFCRREVEPMGKECEQVQALALAEAAGVSVKIAYLDGRQQASGIITHHTFGPDNAVVKMTLLYRPGHYDILYPRQTLPSS
jgi:ubiquitin thioesterase protein OTUB1